MLLTYEQFILKSDFTTVLEHLKSIRMSLNEGQTLELIGKGVNLLNYGIDKASKIRDFLSSTNLDDISKVLGKDKMSKKDFAILIKAYLEMYDNLDNRTLVAYADSFKTMNKVLSKYYNKPILTRQEKIDAERDNISRIEAESKAALAKSKEKLEKLPKPIEKQID